MPSGATATVPSTSSSPCSAGRRIDTLQEAVTQLALDSKVNSTHAFSPATSAPPLTTPSTGLDNAACGGLRPGAPAHAALAVFSRSAPPTAAPALSAPPSPLRPVSRRRRRRRRLAQLVGSLYKGEKRADRTAGAAAGGGGGAGSGDWWWFPSLARGWGAGNAPRDP
ncbi:hypothetical protein R6Z07F_008814 [Ovis aries]